MCLTDHPFHIVTTGQKTITTNIATETNNAAVSPYIELVCLLSNGDILSHVIASKNVSSDSWECYALGKISLFRSQFEKLISA